VNVVFFGGADLDPPPPLGTTDRSRYVKVKTLEEAQGPEMRKRVEQAGACQVGNESPRREDATWVSTSRAGAIPRSNAGAWRPEP
jgi:hypothetical protein